MGSRHPQDPEGKKGHAFQLWLRRDPGHRNRVLRRRLANEYEDTHVLGGIAVALLVIAIVGVGLWRVFTGGAFPGQ